MSRELSEQRHKKSDREKQFGCLWLDNSIARNRGRSSSGYGESILHFSEKELWNGPVYSRLVAFRCRIVPLSGKIVKVKQA